MARHLAAMAAAAFLSTGNSIAQQPDTLAQAVTNLYASLRQESLPNGLRVYLLPVPGAATVTTKIAYRVGSADEEKDQTGLSHYLEHLLFKGTDQLLPGDIDRATQRNGGQNNAYTSEDMTVYHFDFAADRWTIALEIEADRMRNTRIDERHEFQQEKGAVIAELDGGEDQPWDLEYKAILPLLFPREHPYSHPVIGDRRHVRAATAEIIQRHYDKWYHPNNASLVIVGGFDPDQAMQHVKRLFGPIPPGELPRRPAPPPMPPRQQPARTEFPSKFEVPRLMIGFNTIAVGHPDDPVLDLIQVILASGKTSRFYRKLVEQERLATFATAGNNAGRYPGWFSIEVELLKGKDRAKAEAITFQELARLADEPVSDAELARARKKILASLIFSRESVHDQADAIARIACYPGGEDVAAYHRQFVQRLLAVTPADIQRVARTYLRPERAAVVWSLPREQPQPQEPKKGSRLPPAPGHTSPARAGRWIPHRADPQGKSNANAPSPSAPRLTDAQRHTLPNGLTLITLEDHRLPLLYARLEVRDVRLKEPKDQAGVAQLVGELLDEGTAERSGEEIATLIEDSGGRLNFSPSGGAVTLLAPDADLGLSLLLECLTRPRFPLPAFERLRDQQLSAIEESESEPRTRAARLFQAAIYGEHPFARSPLGTRETVARLTPEHCRQFHAQTFLPNESTLVIVGDFATPSIVRRVTDLTQAWAKKDARPLAITPPPPLGPRRQQFVSDSTAAQVHLFLGHLGITRTHPDYHTLLVMDNILGTGPGFTDRLSANLRDRQGLAYTVRATITASAGRQPGTFQGYIGTFPDKLIWVRDAFIKEVQRIRDEPPTEAEVEDAKRYLLGSLPFRFNTRSDVAELLLEAERHGLGWDFLDAYRQQVERVTAQGVQSAARTHLHPEALTIIAVGPIDADGLPLKTK